MIKTNTANLVANKNNNVIEITQISTDKTTNVDIYNFYTLLEKHHLANNKNSIYCSTAKMEITLGSNGHLRSAANIINTYLNAQIIKDLKEYILEEFPDIKKSSKILSDNDSVSKTHKNDNASKQNKINSLPIIEYAEYEEPHYDDTNCNGYPDTDFLGIIGKNGETIEISFEKNDELFAPQNKRVTKNYIVGSNFNLYNQDGENLGWDRHTTLVCSYDKKNNTFEVNLLTTERINYFGHIIKPYQLKQIVAGRLSKPIKYIGYLDELLNVNDDDDVADEEDELPW